MAKSNAEIISYLEGRGIKPSTLRIAIMRYMMENMTHPSADTIYQALVNEFPTMSRTTVYNTLWLFVKHNAISSLDIDRSNMRFDYAESPHAHFICRQCGSIFDLPLEGENNVKCSAGNQLHVEQMNVYYKGLCHNCYESNKKTV